jgi:hypothetical protein
MANTDTPAGSSIYGHPSAWIHSNLESGTPVIIPPDYGEEGADWRYQITGQPTGIPEGVGVPLVPNADIPVSNKLMPFPRRQIVISETQLPMVNTQTSAVSYTPPGTASVSSRVSTKKASAA